MAELPENIAVGDPGHPEHHNTIHSLLERLDDQTGPPYAFQAAGYATGTLAARPVASAANQDFCYYAYDTQQKFVSYGGAWVELTGGGGSLPIYYNVKDHGAIGDGIANDTAAIQAAIDAVNTAGGGIVFFPAASYKVTSLNHKQDVVLLGEGAGASILIGTAGSDVIVLPTVGGNTNFGIEQLGIFGGRRGISYSAGPTALHCTHVILKNVKITSPSDECVYTEGQIEEWYFDDVVFQGGTYGFRHANVPGATFNIVDKCTFKDVISGGGFTQINAWKIEAATGDTCTWINMIVNNVNEHGFFADGSLANFNFIDANMEGNGYSGKNNRTTLVGTVASGATSGTLASATGWASGDKINIRGASTVGGRPGVDHNATVVSVVGALVTWDTATSLTVADPPATNSAFDDWHFGQAIGAPYGWNWFGGVIGNQIRGIRYAVGDGASALNFSGVGFGAPVYDPLAENTYVGCLGSVRTATSMTVNRDLRFFRISPTYSVQPDSIDTMIPSGPGKGLVLSMRDSADNGSGTFGTLDIRRYDPNRTRVAFMEFGDDRLGQFTLPWGTAQGARMNVPGGISTTAKLGPPTDADWPVTNPPPDGTIVIDMTPGTPKIWARVSGIWRFALLT